MGVEQWRLGQSCCLQNGMTKINSFRRRESEVQLFWTEMLSSFNAFQAENSIVHAEEIGKQAALTPSWTLKGDVDRELRSILACIIDFVQRKEKLRVAQLLSRNQDADDKCMHHLPIVFAYIPNRILDCKRYVDICDFMLSTKVSDACFNADAMRSYGTLSREMMAKGG